MPLILPLTLNIAAIVAMVATAVSAQVMVVPPPIWAGVGTAAPPDRRRASLPSPPRACTAVAVVVIWRNVLLLIVVVPVVFVVFVVIIAVIVIEKLKRLINAPENVLLGSPTFTPDSLVLLGYKCRVQQAAHARDTRQSGTKVPLLLPKQAVRRLLDVPERALLRAVHAWHKHTRPRISKQHLAVVIAALDGALLPKLVHRLQLHVVHMNLKDVCIVHDKLLHTLKLLLTQLLRLLQILDEVRHLLIWVVRKRRLHRLARQ
jgi:hypothetical protein